MPAPIPLHQRRLPAHLAPPPARPPETDADRRARQLSLTRELTELNMIAARSATIQLADQDPDVKDETSAANNPTLALARATRAVLSIMNIENRIAAGERAPLPAFEDPRGQALRKLLHPLTAAEPDPGRRRALRIRLNDRIDDALATDLDDDIPLGQIATIIAAEHGLHLDMSRIPDEYLDPPSAHASAPASDPASDHASAHASDEARPESHSPGDPDRPEAKNRDHR